MPCQDVNIPYRDATPSASASPTVQLWSFPQKASTIRAAVSGSLVTAVRATTNIWGEWQNPSNTSLSQRGESNSLLLQFLSCRVYSLGRFLFYWLRELNRSLTEGFQGGRALVWAGMGGEGQEREQRQTGCCSSRIEVLG